MKPELTRMPPDDVSTLVMRGMRYSCKKCGKAAHLILIRGDGFSKPEDFLTVSCRTCGSTSIWRETVPPEVTPEERYAVYQQRLRDLMAQAAPAVNGERRFFRWIAGMFRSHWRD